MSELCRVDMIGAKSKAYNIKKLMFNSIYILHIDGRGTWTLECPL